MLKKAKELVSHPRPHFSVDELELVVLNDVNFE